MVLCRYFGTSREIGSDISDNLPNFWPEMLLLIDSDDFALPAR
jgi:hypothetical protein